MKRVHCAILLFASANGQSWFIQTAAAATVNNSVFVTQTVPATMSAGQTAQVSMSFRDTGNTFWTPQAAYRLGSQAPQDNSVWGLQRVEMGGLALPPVLGIGGTTVQFTFAIRAPQTPGQYSFQWRMLRENVEWFGAYSPLVTITVQPTPPDLIQPPTTTLGGDYAVPYSYTPRPGVARSSHPVSGIADTHTHPMAHLAFGKKAFFGQPDGPISSALPDCSFYHGPGGIGWFGQVGNLLFAGVEGSFGHSTGGYPDFDGWPRFTSKFHQQMYVDWIRRTYDGGLRLMVAHAVQNGLLAKEFAGSGYNDGASIDEQIQGMKDFAERNSGWMEIAYSPSDARRIIGANKLAVILGVEVDSLGTPTRDFGAGEVPPLAQHLQQLYDHGVRHIFPVHLADNNLGSTAVFSNMFNILNWHLRGNYFNVNQGPLGVQFRLDQRTSDDNLLVAYFGASGFQPPDYSSVPGGHANRNGLTSTGHDALLRMMRLGMIIDTDHMSDSTFESALALAEVFHYPVLGGHMAMRELGLDRSETGDPHKLATEFGRTGSQLQRMIALGGMIGVGMNQTHLHTFTEANGLRNDAHNTSKSFAQAYLYAVDHAGGAGVAIGTDFNGLPGSLGPRFGPAALPGYDDAGARSADLAKQTNGVHYSTPLRYVKTARWNCPGIGLTCTGDALTGEQTDVFQAIALAGSGQDIDGFDLNQVSPKVRSIGSQIWIRNIAKGMRASRLSDLPSPSVTDMLFNYNSARVQQAAFYAKTTGDPNGIKDDEIRRVYGQIRPVYLMYGYMDGPNPPLTRSIAGNRDFDINVDGVAHIGMLPDLLQDLKNNGVTNAQLAPLFRSAEDYIAMWETAESRRATVPSN